MKKYFGYVRVSTKKQGKGVSLEEQRFYIEEFAHKNNLHIVEWFEEKHSASKEGRPVFTDILKRLKRHKADGIIIHKTDRGMRNYYDWAHINALVDNGIEVHFTHEAFDMQTVSGRFTADLFAAQSIHYSRNLSTEIKKGTQGLLKRGIYPLPAPVGYINKGQASLKEVDPIKGILIRTAFELYASEKYTIYTLAEKMEKLGLKNTRNNIVRPNALYRILTNQFYMGVIKVKGVVYEGKHNPIVDPKTFKKVQDIMQGKGKAKILKNNFPFRRALKCGHCNYSLIGEKQKGNIYYRCHTDDCPTKAMRESNIDKYLTWVLTPIQLYPVENTQLLKLLEDEKIDWTAKQDNLLQAFKLQKEALKARLERLVDLLEDNAIDKDAYITRKTKVLTELQEIHHAEDQLIKENHITFRRVKKFLELTSSLIKSYETAKTGNMREFLETVTSNLSVKGKNLVFTMVSPFFEVAEKSLLPFCAENRNTPRTFVFNESSLPPNPRSMMTKREMRDYLEFLMQNTQLHKFQDEELD